MRRKRRRGNGEGSIVRLSGKRRLPFAAVITVGWTPEGRPIRRSRFASSEKAAKALLADMRRAHESSRPLPDDRLTVGKWLAQWLAHVEDHVRPGTADNYEGTIRRYLLPDLGTLPLRTLTPSRVETMLTRLAASGLSANTQAQARDVLRRAVADAVKDGHLDRNVAALARPPKVARQRKPAPTAAEVRALLDAMFDHRLRDMVAVMAATGLRVSEAMGLRWQDVDGSTLTIHYQLAWVDGEAVLADPKSDRSRRPIGLCPFAVTALRSQKARQAKERLAAGDRWRDATGLVFLTREGRPLSESTVQWVIAQACKAAGLRHISPHDLRRFAATAVTDAAGKDVAQGLLGHTERGMTDRYVTVTDDSRRRAADALEAALG